MLRRWPIAFLLCLTFVMAGLAIAGDPGSSSNQQAPAVAALLSPAGLPVANPQRQLAATHISRSIGSTLPASSSSLPSLVTAPLRGSDDLRQPLLATRGVIDCRAPPSPRSL